MQRFIRIFPLLLFMPFLAGCPHMLMQEAEKLMPPKDYKPVYMSSSTTLDKFLRENSDSAKGNPPGAMKTLNFSDSVQQKQHSPLILSIRELNDRAYPKQVELRVFVSDSSGKFIRGLAPPNFKGKGDWKDYWRSLHDSCSGLDSAIQDFTVTEVHQDTREPHAVAFVLDHSPSMGDPRARRLQEAIRKTLGIIRGGDQVAVVKFTGRMTTEVPLTGDSSVYKRLFRVDGLNGNYGGGTAIYDGVQEGVAQLNKAPSNYRKAVILFTDGEDNASKTSIDSVIRLCRESQAAVYSVAYGLTDEQPLRDLSQHSGGRFYRIYSSKEFPFVFADIYRSLNTYYRIGYTPPECASLHTVEVALTMPELHTRFIAQGEYDRSIFHDFDRVGTISLVDIEFDYGKSGIREESLPKLREIADMMKKNSGMKLEIRGHTDDIGSDDFNLKLSGERAQSVAAALTGFGVERTRLQTKGMGESAPLVANDSEENRRRNRRTEFIILSK